jgi:Retroviral aspartyl protease.
MMNLIIITICTVTVAIIASLMITERHYKKKVKKPLKFPFEETIDKTGLPIVSFEQNGEFFNFLIDSGSDSSTLNSSSLNKLEYVNLEGNNDVYGIDGNKIQTYYVGVKLFSHETKFKEIFQVMDIPGLDNIYESDGIRVHGILGSNFMRRYGFLIDFTQLKVYTNGKERTVENI